MQPSAQEVENPLSHHADGSVKYGGVPSDWIHVKEQEQEEQRHAQTGQLVFRYPNGDPIPFDWCFVMRLEGPPKRPYPLPDEAREIIERMLNVGLYVKHHIGIEGRQLFIQIGATLPMMMHEATHHMDLQMQVKGVRPCRGTIPFHEELAHHFQSAEDYEAGKAFRFNSGQRQLIIMNLIQRLAQIDPYAKIRAESRFVLLQRCKDKAVTRGHGMQRWGVKELLEANLCTTMTSMQQSTTLRLPVCMKLYNKLVVDAAVEVATQGQANPGERVDAADCVAIVAELEAKTLGDSKTIEDVMRRLKDKKLQAEAVRQTTFVCRMTHCYPLHDQHELDILVARWADFKNMTRWNIPWEMDQGTRIVTSWGMFYQPTTLVREYFGDHVALYFAWLQMYTRWLRFAAATGALTMLGNYMAEDGIDSNPLVLAYSIFLSLWSTLFNEAWEYRQKELQFLWGTAGYEEHEQPRPQFRGVIEEDEVTGRKALVEENPWSHHAKMFASMIVMLLMTVLVIFGALAAFSIRHTDAVVYEKCFNPCTALEMEWAETKFTDNWEDYRVVTEKATQCNEVYVNTHDSEPGVPFCVFTTPQAAGQEFGRCEAAEFWINATSCELLVLEEDTTARDRAACEAIISCSYTSFSVGGVEDPDWWQINRWKLCSSLINLVLIQGGGQVYGYLAGRLNYWENHRTETEYTDNLIAKVMMFEFVNNYFTLFYIAFLINLPIFGEKQTGCGGRSCMAELQWQLLIVFTGKTFAKKVVEIAKPFVTGYYESSTTKRQLQQSPNQQQRLSGRVAGSVQSSVAPATRGAAEKLFSQPCERERYLAEYGQHRYPGTFEDMKEMVIQFGYVTMFAASFPLAGLFAMVNNVFEMRSDAWLLCIGHQRPRFKPQEDLGSWFNVLFIVSLINTMVNAGLTAFVGAQLDDSEGTFATRIRNPNLWAIAVGIEHAVLALKFTLKTLMPSEPDWIPGAKEVLEYRQNQPDDLMPQSVKRQRESMRKFAPQSQYHHKTAPGTGLGSVRGDAETSDARFEAAQRVIGETCKTLNCDRATIYLAESPSAGNGSRPDLVSYVASGAGHRSIRIASTAGIAGVCFTSDQPVLIDDAYSDKRFLSAEDLRTGYRTHSILCMPIRDNDTDITIGVLQALNKYSRDGDDGRGSARRLAQGGFSQVDQTAAHRLAVLAAIAVKNAAAQDAIQTFAAASNRHGHINAQPPPVAPRPAAASTAAVSAYASSLRQRQPPQQQLPQQQQQWPQQPQSGQQASLSFVGTASSALAVHNAMTELHNNLHVGAGGTEVNGGIGAEHQRQQPQLRQPAVSAQDLSHNRETWC